MAKNAKGHKLKPSTKMWAASMLWGALAAGGLYWLWSGMYWWVYLVVGLVVGQTFYSTWLETASQERIIDDD